MDKLLRGTKPADLPTQGPRSFDFVVNVKAAEDLSITFPPDVAAPDVQPWLAEAHSTPTMCVAATRVSVFGSPSTRGCDLCAAR